MTGGTLATGTPPAAGRMPSPRRALTAALVAQVAVSVSEQGLPVLTGFIKRDLALSAAVAGVLAGAVPAGKAIGSYEAMWLALAIVVTLSLVPALLVREPSETPAPA